MENSTRPMQQLSREQLELVKFCERMKYRYREEGLELRQRAKETILGLMKTLFMFLGVNCFHCRQILYYDAWSNFMVLMLLCLVGVALMCWDTLHMINQIFAELDWLLEKDGVLRRDVDVLARNIRDSIEVYKVTSDFGGGPVVISEVRILPHIWDHGECLSLLVLLKKLVKEPSVVLNRLIYRLLVTLLFSFGMLFFIGLSVISHYTMLGNESWDYDTKFELLKPT